MNIYSYGNFTDKVKLYNVENKCYSQSILDMRKAAQVHKQVRQEALKKIKVGTKILDICNFIENRVIELSGQNDLKAGMGFPTGFSINNCAAHDSALPNDTRIIKKGDMIKIDFGTHVNGNIIDSAFTVSFAEEEYNKLIDATKEAMWAGIKQAGPDALIEEITNTITEVVESHELEINNKKIPITPCIGLGGHNILPYTIHGGKLIMNNKKSFPKEMSGKRMSIGEIYAIEVFASSDSGVIKIDPNMETSHYMIVKNHPKITFGFNATRDIYNWIRTKRSTLPFCTRWLYNEFGEKYKIGLNELMKKGVLMGYPPLVDNLGSYTAQTEHTIYLHDFGKEVLSQSIDY
jgi:methionyl aminopeptidase